MTLGEINILIFIFSILFGIATGIYYMQIIHAFWKGEAKSKMDLIICLIPFSAWIAAAVLLTIEEWNKLEVWK